MFVEEERLDRMAARREAVMLGLRLRAGVDPAAFGARFGGSLAELCGPALEELRAGGFLEWHAGRLRLSAKALLVSNEVLVRLGLT